MRKVVLKKDDNSLEITETTRLSSKRKGDADKSVTSPSRKQRASHEQHKVRGRRTASKRKPREKHRAIYYAMKYGWTHSDATTYVERYFDDLDLYGTKSRLVSYVEGRPMFSYTMYSFYLAMDLICLIRTQLEKIKNPRERAKMKVFLYKNLRKVQRPFYYANETRRRHLLSQERRKVKRRTTLAAEPSPEEIEEAYIHRNDSKESMIRLGGLLQDLECYVDNCLVFNEDGNIIRRNGGIKGWLRLNLPELVPHYKNLMRYKAMAIKLRQATKTHDPIPTSRLLVEPHHDVVKEILALPKVAFSLIITVLNRHVLPQHVFEDPLPT